MAAIACAAAFAYCFYGFNLKIAEYTEDGNSIAEMYTYFTTLISLLILVDSAIVLPYAVSGIRKKRFTLPKWLSMLHFSTATCAILMLLFTLIFILPESVGRAFGGGNFELHIICPAAILISYCMLESHYKYSLKDILICILPFIAYSLVYLVMVVFIGEENGGWEDLYSLTDAVPAAVALVGLYALIFAIAWLIKKLTDIMTNVRKKHMVASWRDDLEPEAVNKEVYNLGRRYGKQGVINDVEVPIDILSLLADHYNMDLKKLCAVYMDGMYGGAMAKGFDK